MYLGLEVTWTQTPFEGRELRGNNVYVDEDGGSVDLRNVGIPPQYYTTQKTSTWNI